MTRQDSSYAMGFTQIMRKTSREVHSLSDALVNAKLGATASSDRVWREGLAIFYRIFRFLEHECLDRSPSLDIRLTYLKIEGMERTERFEDDLKHYYGRSWRSMIEPMSPELVKYIEHLEKLKQEEPVVLSAYIYHLYMGLFAGGQILKKKRAVVNKVPWWMGGSILRSHQSSTNQGLAVVSFDRPLGDLKRSLREGMEDLAAELDENTKQRIIEEGVNLFKLNNSIIRTIRSTDEVLYCIFIHRVLPVLLAFVAAAVLFSYALKDK